ncbi:uncharacterized protein [Rutidosis leptorrhynchoides]|uniref:uncharacterized protein n=1 Tax=Rutidosis leptorrhynchoides TaxID=125765 RepID=UPI003A9918A9
MLTIGMPLTFTEVIVELLLDILALCLVTTYTYIFLRVDVHLKLLHTHGVYLEAKVCRTSSAESLFSSVTALQQYYEGTYLQGLATMLLSIVLPKLLPSSNDANKSAKKLMQVKLQSCTYHLCYSVLTLGSGDIRPCV